MSTETDLPIFFRLPKALLINFLSKWLDIQDVGLLDAAMTTRALRPKFLQYLQEMRSTTVNGHTMGGGGKGRRSCTFLNWLSSRRIYVEEITVWDIDSSFIIMENLELPFLRKLFVGGKKSIETNLIHLVKSSPALKSITIHAGQVVVHEVFRQIADHCPLLEKLVPVCIFSIDDLLYLLNKCSALTKLTLRCPTTRSDRDEWEDDNWERFRPYGHLMHELSVYGKAYNPQAFADFLSACPLLQKLIYIGVENENHGMILLRAAQSCPLLEDLSFDTHSPTSVLALSRNCKKLREVRIRCPLSTTDLACFNQIETLETLSLEGNNDLTSEHLAVISGFRNLKELTISCNNAVFLDGLFLNTPISRSLEKIIFHRGGSGVVPLSVLSCLTPCSKLREINIYHRFCDDAGMKILATHFPLLEDLVTEYVKEHVVGLTFLITQCKHLKQVSLTRPDSNDEVAQACFQEHLKGLRYCFPHVDFQSVQRH